MFERKLSRNTSTVCSLCAQKCVGKKNFKTFKKINNDDNDRTFFPNKLVSSSKGSTLEKAPEEPECVENNIGLKSPTLFDKSTGETYGETYCLFRKSSKQLDCNGSGVKLQNVPDKSTVSYIHPETDKDFPEKFCTSDLFKGQVDVTSGESVRDNACPSGREIPLRGNKNHMSPRYNNSKTCVRSCRKKVHKFGNCQYIATINERLSFSQPSKIPRLLKDAFKTKPPIFSKQFPTLGDDASVTSDIAIDKKYAISREQTVGDEVNDGCTVKTSLPAKEMAQCATRTVSINPQNKPTVRHHTHRPIHQDQVPNEMLNDEASSTDKNHPNEQKDKLVEKKESPFVEGTGSRKALVDQEQSILNRTKPENTSSGVSDISNTLDSNKTSPDIEVVLDPVQELISFYRTISAINMTKNVFLLHNITRN